LGTVQGEPTRNNQCTGGNDTINKDEMDNFLKHFKNDIMVLHEKIGVPIIGTLVNRPHNEFIWVRT
jgi:hypothetical protein